MCDHNLKNGVTEHLCNAYFQKDKQWEMKELTEGDHFVFITWKDKGDLYTYIETEKEEDEENFDNDEENEEENYNMKISYSKVIRTKNGNLHSLDGEPALYITKESYICVENYGGEYDVVTNDQEEYEAFYNEGKLHNLNGYAYNDDGTEKYYIEGVYYKTKKEYKKRISQYRKEIENILLNTTNICKDINNTISQYVL